jgi:hypothetical protein
VKRRVQIFHSFEEAEKAEIQEDIAMTPDQRLKIIHQLRIRAYGRKPVDIRKYHKKA